MRIAQLSTLNLQPGDHIVSAVQFQGFVIAISARGHIYKIEPEEF